MLCSEGCSSRSLTSCLRGTMSSATIGHNLAIARVWWFEVLLALSAIIVSRRRLMSCCRGTVSSATLGHNLAIARV